MLAIAYYFLQVILCSAVMMGYYLLMLRNKRFHQYNRFYLLCAAVLPWLVPLVKIELNKPSEIPTNVIHLVQVVASNNSEMEATVAGNSPFVNWYTFLACIYITVAGCLLLAFVFGLLKLYRLLKEHSCKSLGDIYLVLTEAEGTPFSFFRFIFWNTAIDVETPSGSQILQHELAHVTEKHSVDKLLMQLVLIIGWFNPFFWLLRRELNMIHEFIADTRAVENGDTAALASMLLTAAYPRQQFALSNPFFYSPIKRRLQMLTNNQNPRFSYIRRLTVLPLLVVVTLLFAFRAKKNEPVTISFGNAMECVVKDITGQGQVNDNRDNTRNHVQPANAALDKTYTVVIDAGHGGLDGGAQGPDGTKESDITLAIAKTIRNLNTNPNIHIVMTRTDDTYSTPLDRVNFATKEHADLFISVHTNSGNKPNMSGFEICTPSHDDNPYKQNSYVLSTLLANSLQPVDNDIKIAHRQTGIWVIDKGSYPSSLIECGYITNEADLKKMKDKAYQKQLAEGILNGINSYLQKQGEALENLNKVTMADTAPSQSLSRPGMIVIGSNKGTTKEFRSDSIPLITGKDRPMIMVDGRVLSKDTTLTDLSLNPRDIYAIEVFKDDSAATKMGAKNGLIKIYTRSNKEDYLKHEIEKKEKEVNDLKVQLDSTRNSAVVFTTSQVAPEFIGGVSAWQRYLLNNLDYSMVAKKGGPPGRYTVVISFTVNEKGHVNDFYVEKDPGYGTAGEVMRVIRNSPAWKPGMQNGYNVTCRVKREIAFVVKDDKGR